MAKKPTQPAAQVQIFCDTCGGGTRNHQVHASYEYSGSNDEAGFWWGGTLQICQCAGCDAYRFREVTWFSEDTDDEGRPERHLRIYPERKPGSLEAKSEFVTLKTVGSIYSETVGALNAGLRILSGAGLRAIVEAICLEQGTPGKNLLAKIDALATNGLLTKAQAEFLHEERFIGNSALHELAAPPEKDLLLGFEIIEGLLNTIYVLPQKAAQLRTARKALESVAKPSTTAAPAKSSK